MSLGALKTATILAYLLALLSVAAAIPKLLQMPQELGFLAAIGFSEIGVCMLGVVQLMGGVLLAVKRWRLAGAILAGLAFLVSSIAIFVAGNTTFGLLSLIPVALTGFVAAYCNGNPTTTHQSS